MAAQRKFKPGDIYAGARKGTYQLGNIGALKTASREVLRAQVTGTPVDMSKVGKPGDVIIGGQGVADFLNELTGASPQR